jgi:hypothetical protein
MEEFFGNFQVNIAMGTRGRTGLVGVGCTLAKLRRVAGTWDEQGNNYTSCVSGIATAPSSDVISYNNENPSITLFFPVAYLE